MEYLNKNFPQFEESLRGHLIERATTKNVHKGETMIQTGQYFRSTMLVLDGRLKVYRKGEEGEDFFMYYLEPGNACALSMVCAQHQVTSGVMIKATEDSIVLMIPMDMMESLMTEFKSWYLFVVETYRSRFEELLLVVDNIAFRSMDERLISYLENQQRKLKSSQLYLTHQEIATDLNSSREVISRLLKKLEQRQKVQLFRNYIELL